MKLLLGFISILLFLGCGSKLVPNQTSINKEARMGLKEALIVGVSNYKGEKYDLEGVIKDRQNMKILFEKWGFNVTLLADEHSMNIEKYLQNYSHLKDNDAFVFYYSGHGYHTKDVSGDEDDGQDEALILSDGRKNKFFLDDALFGYLNKISAKKMLLLDSCHSGTAFRSLNNGMKPKSIGANEISGVMKTRAFRVNESKISKGEYIIFSASQDEEQSLDTKEGGLFTNALLEQFSNGGEEKKLSNIRWRVDETISELCRRANSTPHHPKLSVSSSALKDTSINQFFKIGVAKTPLVSHSKTMVQNKISIIGKTKFKEKELLSFDIDTNGNRGYMTIYSIEKGEPFILAKTIKAVSGTLHFQKDFNLKNPIECYKDCHSCATDISTVYVVLSEGLLNQNLLKGQLFLKQDYEKFKPIIVKKDFIIY